MNILQSDSHIFGIKNTYKLDSESDTGKNYNINKRRKTACEREAIFNRLILNNPSIIRIDTTLLPGTCVYCNICQVRIILNPAYYLNNWRTHMNGKLHKALSKAVGSPHFIDEVDFFQEKEDSYFEMGGNVADTGNCLGNDGTLESYENTNNENDMNASNIEFSLKSRFKNDEDYNMSEVCIQNNTLTSKKIKIMNENNKLKERNIEVNLSNEYCDYDIPLMDRKEVLDFDNERGDEVRAKNYVLENETKKAVGDAINGSHENGDILNKNVYYYQNSTDININYYDSTENQKCVIHPIISNTQEESKQEEIESQEFNNCITNSNEYECVLFTGNLSGVNKKNIKDENTEDQTENNNESEATNTVFNDSNPESLSKTMISPLQSPFLKINFSRNCGFRCPGINKVRYWAMCFIGSERSKEPNINMNYNDTRRVFYRQSIITKIIPNNEPEHQGVVHHPNCFDFVSKPNQPCERCSLYVNNRQLARVISKRATRLQEMWDRVIAGESILNGGTIPQSIISAYNHRIDHWTRCNDPLEAITRALAGCRQRDYTNFFWKIRENLLQNSRLFKNNL